MKLATWQRTFISSALLLWPGALLAQSTTANFVAAKDNTLYVSEAGTLSNGAGSFLFAGNDQNGGTKRGLIQFNLSSIPANAVVDSVSLKMNMSKTTGGSATVSLRKVTKDWGEGTSKATGEEGGGGTSTTNDATWIHTFFNTSTWNSPGGDFVAQASASINVNNVGSYTWGSTSGMVADVQAWVNDASQNFGWIVIGDEEVVKTAKRFDSRQNNVAANRPTLTVHYSQPTSISDRDAVPAAFQLEQNYPNPFNPQTTIKYSLDKPAKVTLTVFDLLGNTVAVLVDAVKNSGEYEVVFDATGIETGVYFYQIAVAGSIQTRKLTLIK